MTDFGSDISCVTDIAADGRTVTGNRVVAEAVARRLLTPRGRLIGDPNYGFYLTQFVNADMSPRDIANMNAGIVSECLKDERVEASKVATVLDSLGVMTVTIDLTLSTGPFTLALSVTDVTVTILRVDP